MLETSANKSQTPILYHDKYTTDRSEFGAIAISAQDKPIELIKKTPIFDVFTFMIMISEKFWIDHGIDMWKFLKGFQ